MEMMEQLLAQDNEVLLKTDKISESSVITYVDEIFKQAVLHRASDIHFEPDENSFRIRFRIDGVLSQMYSPTHQWANKITARLKAIANLDIAEKRQPQDGRLYFNLSSTNNIQFRVSSLPTLWGEKVVLRVVNDNSSELSLTQLGFETSQQVIFQEMLTQSQGLILVTGPTGAGKSLTLYSGLAALNSETLNISTVEDPVEKHMLGVTQVQVSPKVGLSFASVLRALLRQDPDVLMVGEIRDSETADIAIKAAQTGHLVLSTLHTKSALEAINRLHNMGVARYNLASSVSLIIAQRLVRKLCHHCKVEDDHEQVNVLLKRDKPDINLSKVRVFKAVGCHHCQQGYLGRTGIIEMVRITPKMQAVINNEVSMSALHKCMKDQKVMTLRQAGLAKICEGVTSVSEMNRVLGKSLFSVNGDFSC